jgi:Holliday junction resolvase RusA-like endonuclease
MSVAELIADVWVPGRPRPKGSWSQQGKRLTPPPGVAAWQRLMSQAVADDMRRRGTTPVPDGTWVTVVARFVMPMATARYGDLDKLLRCALDALTGVAYADDRQVIDAPCTRLPGERVMAGAISGAYLRVLALSEPNAQQIAEAVMKEILPAVVRAGSGEGAGI